MDEMSVNAFPSGIQPAGLGEEAFGDIGGLPGLFGRLVRCVIWHG